MKRNIIIIAAVFSIVMNIAFVTMWSIHFVQVKRQAECNRTQCNNLKMPCSMHRTIGITRGQWQQIRPELEKFSDVSKIISDSIDTYRYQIVECMSKDSIDTVTLAHIQEQILHLQKKLQLYVIEYMRSEKKVLTRKQQKELYELINARWFYDRGKACFNSPQDGVSSSCCETLHE